MLKERYGRNAAARYDADTDNVPQRLLMPGVNDPSLWTVRVKVSHISIKLMYSLVGNNLSAHPFFEKYLKCRREATPSISFRYSTGIHYPG
jgi:transcription elongation factor SPT5